jgi:hypothetical protein
MGAWARINYPGTYESIPKCLYSRRGS